MLVSVVVCTYNRAAGLRATLDCLRQQRYTSFEVVVVNGPSTDDTSAVCAEFGNEIRLVDNPAANLSISRNLGIRASSGDIVAFIDDDALPEPAWLEQAIAAFSEDDVAGVGGIVLDHTGMNPQYTYSASNRFGQPSFAALEPFDALCVPGADTFPYLQGTNALFRRDALAEIGLFDETFDFYLDETDVCIRLVDAGYRLRQLDTAPVHHKYLPSARRSERKVVTNWYSIVRNHVYFGYRHALDSGTELDVMRDAHRFGEYACNDALYHEQMGAAPVGHVGRTAEMVGRAIVDGAVLGRERRSLRLARVSLDPPPFTPFSTVRHERPLKIALVSSGYPPDFAGGIGRFVGDVAPVLARRGHEVRVFAKTHDVARVDLEDGVWVHRLDLDGTVRRLGDAPDSVDSFASAVVDELERIDGWWQPDVAYGSLWDVELLGIARELPHVPVVPMLATPAAEVAEHEGWSSATHPNFDLISELVRLERELMARASRVHAISEAIVGTVDRLYPGALRRDRVIVQHIGRADTLVAPQPTAADRSMVLFLGRLEPRKGIDTFLRAARVVVGRDSDAEFVVVGDDSRLSPSGETYQELWSQLAGDSAHRLRFTGALPDAEVEELICDSLIVTMPSRYESFGLVVVEAMMHGRAVVASAIGGIVELINDGVNGLLVPVDDVGALAEALVHLLRDPDLAASLGRAGREHFENHLSAEAAADRLEFVLASATAVAGGSS